MAKCELVPLHEVLDEIKALSPEHYADAVKDNKYEPINIDWDYFKALSNNGNCYAVTLRKNDILVGYSVYIISPDPLRKNKIEATNVCLFVKKAFRGNGTLRILVKAADYMSGFGAKKITYAIKSAALIRLLHKMNYKEEERLLEAAL